MKIPAEERRRIIRQARAMDERAFSDGKSQDIGDMWSDKYRGTALISASVGPWQCRCGYETRDIRKMIDHAEVCEAPPEVEP
jgi:hypothetical protein